MSYTQLTIVGNLGSEPELKFTTDGKAVCNFSLATNGKWKDSDGNQQERTTWFRVAIWGNQAEACHTHLSKGSQVLVAADRIEAKAYVSHDGEARASLEVTARRVQFLGSKNDPDTSKVSVSTNDGDDIPF